MTLPTLDITKRSSSIMATLLWHWLKEEALGPANPVGVGGYKSVGSTVSHFC